MYEYKYNTCTCITCYCTRTLNLEIGYHIFSLNVSHVNRSMIMSSSTCMVLWYYSNEVVVND